MTQGVLAGMVQLTFPGAEPVGLVPQPPVQGFISPVRRNQSEGVTTVLTLQSTGTAVTAEVALRDPNGDRVESGNAVLQLPPDGRVARSLEELFPAADTAEFKGGARHHEQMSIIAKGLSDADIADLIAWYASIEISVKIPE